MVASNSYAHRPARNCEPLRIAIYSLLRDSLETRVRGVNEIVFEITQEPDAGFCAECLFAQRDT
jgi:hypothetical protein